jgi:hypothetical protein
MPFSGGEKIAEDGEGLAVVVDMLGLVASEGAREWEADGKGERRGEAVVDAVEGGADEDGG